MRLFLIIPVLLFLLFQTGCWSAREIDELAFVMGIALDQEEDGRVKVTVQMSKPDTHSKSPAGGGGGDKEKPYWLATGTGSTFFEAIRNMALFSSRRVFWSHNKVLILGEKLAKKDISEILDFFSRNPELRLRTWIAVAPGRAGEILEKSPIMERDPAPAIERLFQLRVWTGKAQEVMLKDFLEDYLSRSTYPTASRLTIVRDQPHPTPQLAGAAVFSKDRMAGWLGERETRGLLWLQGKIENPVLVVRCPFDGKPMSIEVVGSKINYKSGFNGPQPILSIQAKARGNLSEQGCSTDFSDPEKLKELEESFARVISQDIEAAIRVAQKDLGLDFPGFNRVFHRQQRKQWDSLERDWPRLFREMEISLRVEAELPRVSLFAIPLKPMKQD